MSRVLGPGSDRVDAPRSNSRAAGQPHQRAIDTAPDGMRAGRFTRRSPNQALDDMPAAIDPKWTIPREHIEFCREGQVEKLLGQGAFGKVFKATKRGHSQPVAVKIIELDDQADDAAHDQTRRIAREQSLLQELVDSRYFVCFLGAFQTSTSVGMVFEMMPGGDLREALATEKVQLFSNEVAHKRAVQILTDIILGLDYLEKRGFVHLDLKSKNILLGEDYAAKLADVGIARRLLDSQVRTVGTTVGTWGWAAPETILRDYPITGKADIYSMGVIIWELHTGEIPLGRIIRSEDCPHFQHIIAACTRRVPDNRPTARQLLHMVQAALAASTDSGWQNKEQHQPRAALIQPATQWQQVQQHLQHWQSPFVRSTVPRQRADQPAEIHRPNGVNAPRSNPRLIPPPAQDGSLGPSRRDRAFR